MARPCHVACFVHGLPHLISLSDSIGRGRLVVAHRLVRYESSHGHQLDRAREELYGKPSLKEDREEGGEQIKCRVHIERRKKKLIDERNGQCSLPFSNSRLYCTYHYGNESRGHLQYGMII